MDDNLIDLGTRFEVDLYDLSNNAAGFTIEQLIAALEATKTMTELTVVLHKHNVGEYDPTPANNRRFIEPLCRCISNLRDHNAQHPLRHLRFFRKRIDENVMRDVFAQFLVAAKQFGIFHLEFSFVRCLPVEFLMDFCRDNNSLQVLHLDNVRFSSRRGAALPLNNGPPNNPVILTLDGLYLDRVSFDNSTAATVFANLVAHVTVSSLCLGDVTAHNDDDIQITEGILSELKMPSAKQLTLYSECRKEHFEAALDAGTTTVTNLKFINWYEHGDITAKLELLASFIRRAVKLNSLMISRYSQRPRNSPPPQFFQALEACATVMQIQVVLGIYCDDRHDLSPDEVQQLEKITSRNRELDRFATNPGTYPAEELPELMRQFDNCPSGLYILARRLPEVLSFAEPYAMDLLRRQTNFPPLKKAKLE